MKDVKKNIKTILPDSLLDEVRRVRNLTVIPRDSKTVISDLFPFNLKDKWTTCFELLNLPLLINPKIMDDQEYKVVIIFFNENGEKIHEESIHNKGCKRLTINISDLVGSKSTSGIGTFACFHLHYLDELVDEQSYMTERGYLGFQNLEQSSVYGYVHGNFDAIAINENKELKCLGKAHLLRSHEFRLQHVLTGKATYDLFFTNTTDSQQKLEINYIDNEHNISTEEIQIPSRGLRVYSKALEEMEEGRIIIKSKLNLPRPVVFRSMSKSFDVFHG